MISWNMVPTALCIMVPTALCIDVCYLNSSNRVIYLCWIFDTPKLLDTKSVNFFWLIAAEIFGKMTKTIGYALHNHIWHNNLGRSCLRSYVHITLVISLWWYSGKNSILKAAYMKYGSNANTETRSVTIQNEGEGAQASTKTLYAVVDI